MFKRRFYTTFLIFNCFFITDFQNSREFSFIDKNYYFVFKYRLNLDIEISQFSKYLELSILKKTSECEWTFLKPLSINLIKTET